MSDFANLVKSGWSYLKLDLLEFLQVNRILQ